jgi:hypothetical protein
LAAAIAEAGSFPREQLKEGVAVKEKDHAETYLIHRGTKWHVPNPETMKLLGAKVVEVPNGALSAFPDCPS